MCATALSQSDALASVHPARQDLFILIALHHETSTNAERDSWETSSNFVDEQPTDDAVMIHSKTCVLPAYRKGGRRQKAKESTTVGAESPLQHMCPFRVISVRFIFVLELI